MGKLLCTAALAAQLLLISQVGVAEAFAVVTSRTTTKSSSSLFSASSTSNDETTTTTTTSKGLFKRDRYIATNRFAVRQNQQAKFEKRWAARKSSLATLEGFQYFHLMRRVQLLDDGGETTVSYDAGSTDEDALENYVSFTIWNKKSHFSAWRTGEAFKEAHGGTSIGAFVSTLVSSAFVLRGAPRPAFYDGLFLQKAVPTSLPETQDGWRTNVRANGVDTLPAECFVAFEKYFVPAGTAAQDFEQYWDQNDDVNMSAVPGFVARSVLRRDGQAKGHGIVALQASEPTYVVATIFDSVAAYQAWSAATTPATTTPLPDSCCTAPPETVFYEGTLVITSPQGA